MFKLLSKLPHDGNDLLNLSLDQIARLGAKKLLIKALDLEVEEYINDSKGWIDDDGHRMVVRNGKGKKRKITTSCGAIEVQSPRINDKRPGLHFSSHILPRYMRKSPNVESVLPILYLKGLSGNAFKEALEGLLGADGVRGLSPSSISVLKKSWTDEMNKWEKREIKDQFVYLWCDGVNVSVRLGEDKKICLLVVIGVNQNGEKKLLAVTSGFKESELGWKEVFSSLIERGLNSPQLIIGDGGLGLWAAIRDMEHFKNTKEQRCWLHKTLNVLDKLPKRVHPQAKELLNEIKNAPTKSDAGTALKLFKDVFEAKYPKAFECLDKDWNKLTSFYSFPAHHWHSIRTSNPIESAFSTVKLRTRTMRGAGSSEMAETMAFKLLIESEKKWRPIRGKKEIEKMLQGVLYIDGVEDVKGSGQQVVA